MQNVLVTGGAGYIGSHACKALKAAGYNPVTFDSFVTGWRQAVKFGPVEEGDLLDRARLDEVFARYQPVAVMHFAALSLVGEAMKLPGKYWRNNVLGSLTLIEAACAAGVDKFVFSSTCATYGVPVALPLTEDNPQVPINPYGRTKLHMEHMMQDYSHAYGLRYAALRYFNAAGADSEGDLGEHHEPETHLIPLILQVALGQRELIEILGDDYPTPDGTCIRDYIHIVDLADAHLRALSRLQQGTQSLACNLGTGEGYSVREVIEAARRVTGHAIPERIAPRRPGDPPVLVAGGTRAFDLLGWRPRRSDLEDILADAWRFHRANPKGFSR